MPYSCRIGVAKLSCNHRVASVCEEVKNLANEGQVSKTTVQYINIAFQCNAGNIAALGLSSTVQSLIQATKNVIR